MKKILAAMLAVVMVFALTACGGSNEDLSAIDVDAENGTVTISAVVNGAFFDSSTMHYIVNVDGSQGDNSMLTAYCDSQDFYDAMIEAGGQPGNTESNTISDGEFVTGQKLEVTLTWEGQEEPVAMADTIVTKGGDYSLDQVFVGNKDNNAEVGSGCIACLNSCYAGITANAAMPYGAVTSGKPSAFLNKDVMPADGTVVKVTFTLK